MIMAIICGILALVILGTVIEIVKRNTLGG